MSLTRKPSEQPDLLSSITPLIAHLWEKNKPLILERLDRLDHAAAHPADASLRKEAIELAHKLAGSLGMFGFPQGTELARQLELGLEANTLDPEQQRTLTESLRASLFPQDAPPKQA